ncbi:hypothetical protein Hanom_Chr16g01520181 [Helianthus anomalus]
MYVVSGSIPTSIKGEALGLFPTQGWLGLRFKPEGTRVFYYGAFTSVGRSVTTGGRFVWRVQLLSSGRGSEIFSGKAMSHFYRGVSPVKTT